MTPIVDALKRSRGIVSAWRELQLGATSAPAAPPPPLDLQFVVRSEHGAGGRPTQTVPGAADHFMTWISTVQLRGLRPDIPAVP